MFNPNLQTDLRDVKAQGANVGDVRDYSGSKYRWDGVNWSREGGSTAPTTTGFNQPAAPDFAGLYQSSYNTNVKPLEEQLSKYNREATEITGGINDNPFLSEATRVGRVAKADELFQKRTANIRNDIATKKADIETQINLASKQFDINSQQAQQALQQFNTLLSSGAFDNISGEELANITRATGLSSSAIQSAVDARKKSNLQTSTMSYDDGTNQGFVVYNPQTGEIINKQVIAESKPTKVTGGGGGTDTKNDKEKQTADAQYLVTLYQNTNKNNPSWQKAHDLRNQYSPNDFYNMLLITYPEAASYIKSVKGIFTQ